MKIDYTEQVEKGGGGVGTQKPARSIFETVAKRTGAYCPSSQHAWSAKDDPPKYLREWAEQLGMALRSNPGDTTEQPGGHSTFNIHAVSP